MPRSARLVFSLVALFALSEAPLSAAAPLSYQADVARSRLFVMVYKDPEALGAKLGHDHVVRARDFTAELLWDPAAPERCKVSFTVPVASLDPDPPELRKRVGLKRMLTKGDRAKVKENLLNQDQLWGDKYPTITFTAEGCTPRGESLDVTGAFTLRGRTRTVKATMKLGIDAATGKLTASGSIPLRHTWFGFKPYAALGGALRNLDEMRLVIVVRASPATP